MKDNKLANRLRELRKSNKLSQSDMAERLNISTSAYGYYEQGKSDLSSETINKIADMFNVTTDYLLGRSSNPQHSENPKSKAAELEEEFPEGISVLYRANEKLTPEQKEMMLRMIKASFFENEEK